MFIGRRLCTYIAQIENDEFLRDYLLLSDFPIRQSRNWINKETDRRWRIAKLEDHKDHVEIKLISSNSILYVVRYTGSLVVVNLQKVSQ